MNARRRRARTSRAVRRSKGKRALRREARRDVVRVIELLRKGFSASTIAATTRIERPLVERILEGVREVAEEELAASRGPKAETRTKGDTK